MKQTADVVVIGGGIQGVSAAYYLAEAGVPNVSLVEMDQLGSGTTRYTASWFVMQSRLETNIRMSQFSYSEFVNFKEKFNVNVDFRQIGSLSINTSENTSKMLDLANSQRQLGVKLEVLDAHQIKALVPFINTDDIGVGLFSPQDGLVDSSAILNAYAKHAKRLGADIQQGVKATSIKTQNGKVVGVNTTEGYISTPTVVNAAGIYDKMVAEWVGIDLPTVKAIRHTILTKPTDILPKDMTLVEILSPEVMYISGEGGAAKYSIGLDETDRFSHIPDLYGTMEKYGDSLMHRMPDIVELEIVNCMAGIRSLPALSGNTGKQVSQVGHSLPILGPVSQVRGYYNDCAWGGLGVSHAPAGGKLISEMITGADSFMDISPFLLSRYGIL